MTQIYCLCKGMKQDKNKTKNREWDASRRCELIKCSILIGTQNRRPGSQWVYISLNLCMDCQTRLLLFWIILLFFIAAMREYADIKRVL